MSIEEKYMKAALRQANKALAIDEVPIGCVIVKDGRIIAHGYNKREARQDPTGHAEIMAIQQASRKLKSWRLEQCDLYVTIEPCIMCCGAIIQSRIKHVFYGAPDFKGGALGSSINVLEAANINHHPEVRGGILLEECSKIVTEYFRQKREKKHE